LAGVLVAIAVVLGACGGDGGSKDEGPVCADCKTYGQPAGDIEVKSGEQFVIQLDSNPTTGYAWAVQSNTDPAVAKKTASQYLAAQPAVVGSGGVQRLVFDARTRGSTTIVLRYEQSFAPDPSDEELTYTVNVT
jgi:inhibitor of cysteine peptidase